MSNLPTYDDEFDNPYRAPEVGGPAKAASPFGSYVGYGGFLVRAGAAIIDSVLMSAVGFVIGVVAGAIMLASDVDPAEQGPQLSLNLLGIVLNLVYFAGMESSAYQATLGKLALGLKVTDLDGRRISFGRALGRELAKIPSALLLGIGYLMVIWDAKKQGLHDKMASTLVLRTR